MKKLFYGTLLLFITSSGFTQTQGELNATEQKKYLAADKELNQVYQQVLAAHKTDAVFVKNLKAAQRLWIQLRDAEVKAMYPARKPGYYGSAHPMCVAIYKTALTNERKEKLTTWLNDPEEGDVCGTRAQK